MLLPEETLPKAGKGPTADAPQIAVKKTKCELIVATFHTSKYEEKEIR